jgi:hypothetical protein
MINCGCDAQRFISDALVVTQRRVALKLIFRVANGDHAGSGFELPLTMGGPALAPS